MRSYVIMTSYMTSCGRHMTYDVGSAGGFYFAANVALGFAAASNFFSSGVILSLLLFSAALAVV